MRDTLLYAFGKRGSMTAADMHKAVVDAQKKEVNDRADDRIDKANAQYTLTAESMGEGGVQTADQFDQLKSSYDHLQKETKAANTERAAGIARINAQNGDGIRANTAPGATNTLPMPQSLQGGSATGPTASPASTGPSNTGLAGLKNDSWLVQYLADTDRQNGFSPGTSAAIGLKESGLNANLVGPANSNGTRDYGMFQINDKNLEDLAPEFRRLYGRDPNWQDPHDSAILQRMVLAKTGGSAKHRLGAYNAGPKNADGSVGQAYADDVLGNKLPLVLGSGMYDNKLPPGATAPQKHEVNVTVNGDFTLNHPNGAPAAAPVKVSAQVGPPQAAGVAY